jgi:alginate O-acetyltransferase complex protein AlgI
MLFNSFEFIPFLVIVYILYWFIFNRDLNIQNILLLASSYYFYSCWDWRFLFLLILSTLIDYSFGLLISRSSKRKKLFLWLSIFNNLAILGFFKYYNFFVLNARSALTLSGFHFDPWLLSVILPVGISFYTFHGMSYVFDIYNGKAKPTKNFIEYAVFVCFFPLLVSGPIERATHLLPQVKMRRSFSYQQTLEGLRLILWGYFLKVVIADSLSVFVNDIFRNYRTFSGPVLILGAIYFSFQLYGDFCGYTNIAIGVAKLFGFELLSNFKYTFFSISVTEYWRRWHISLSTWFYDYVFNPTVAALRDWGKGAVAFGLLFTFFLSGLWHGAGWQFIFYGIMHGVAIVYEFFTKKMRKNLFSKIPKRLKDILSMGLTFSYISLANIFFRADTLRHGFSYVGHIFSGVFKLNFSNRSGLIYVILPLVIDWQQRKSERSVLNIKNTFLRWGMYVFLGMSILIYSIDDQSPFIYFQF